MSAKIRLAAQLRPVPTVPSAVSSRKRFPKKLGKSTQPKPNVMQAFARALVESARVHEILRDLVNSANRHGDLCAALSACTLTVTHLKELIDAEELAL